MLYSDTSNFTQNLHSLYITASFKSHSIILYAYYLGTCIEKGMRIFRKRMITLLFQYITDVRENQHKLSGMPEYVIRSAVALRSARQTIWSDALAKTRRIIT